MFYVCAFFFHITACSLQSDEGRLLFHCKNGLLFLLRRVLNLLKLKVVTKCILLMFIPCRSAVVFGYHIKTSLADAGCFGRFQPMFGCHSQLHCAILSGPSQGQRVEHRRHWLHHWHLSADNGNQCANTWAFRESPDPPIAGCDSAIHRWPGSVRVAFSRLVCAFARRRFSSSAGCPNCLRLPHSSCPLCLYVP